METWCIILISISTCVIIKFFFTHFTKHKNITSKGKLPPGPPAMPSIINFLWIFKPLPDLDEMLRAFRAKYGPMITLYSDNIPTVFVASPSIAHEALIQNGALFTDRPPVPPTVKIINSNHIHISTSFYGPTWRLLRKNLAFEILHPSRIKSFSNSRKWVVLDLLIEGLQNFHSISKGTLPVVVVDHIRHAMFALSIFMCFGDKLDENQIKEIEKAQRMILLSFKKFTILDFWPRSFFKFLYRKRWEELLKLRNDQENLLLPLIRARKKMKDENIKCDVIPYVDTLFDLELTDDHNRKLDEGELITLCSEFIDAGTDTTTTTLQWIMANLVKYPEIQERLFLEIKQTLKGRKEVQEEDLQKLPYLRAIVLEGLRRHPPGYYLLPRKVTQDINLAGYLVPKNWSINFMIAEMGWDPNVWKDPMVFRPERFLSSNEIGAEGEGIDFDITSTREIKMMPFGAGRRICPGHALGFLHMEYILANLVLNFKWIAVDDVDLTATPESSMVMKNSLKSYISPRL